MPAGPLKPPVSLLLSDCVQIGLSRDDISPSFHGAHQADDVIPDFIRSAFKAEMQQVSNADELEAKANAVRRANGEAALPGVTLGKAESLPSRCGSKEDH
jgi:hypothetical protein